MILFVSGAVEGKGGFVPTLIYRGQVPNGPYVLDRVITDGGTVFDGADLWSGPLLWKAAVVADRAVRARRAHSGSVYGPLLIKKAAGHFLFKEWS